MKAEQLLELIKLSGATVLNESLFMELDDCLNLNRTLNIVALGKRVSIVWYHNLITFKFGDALVFADDIVIDGCWPNNFKTNINLIYKGVRCCVIPTECY